MNVTDTHTLKKRLLQLKAVLSLQYSISKKNRDEKLIADTELRIQKISSWLGIKKKPGNEAPTKPISRAAFKEKLNQILSIEAPTEIMVIDTIEELEAIWPQIRGRNIQIKGPAGVTAAARALSRKDIINKRKK